jgi:cephalosporin-C deacetylase-like acetyl esterase
MMFRRNFIGIAAAGALSAADLTSYPGVRYREYSRCLPDYLARLAREAYEKRNAAIATLSTADDVRERQQWARETFWQLIGGRLERTPLNTKTTGEFQRKGYRVEKLVYESRAGFHISGNLYIPANFKPPFPGVLFQMGHALNGKASPTYQRACQGLAQLGYLVLGFDPMGQGERVYYPDSSGLKSRFPSADDEHSHAGKQMLLTGDTSTRLQLWDAVRSLDVLASHPLVDKQRLASTGQSGGGTLTMFLAAVDDRLSAAVVCSGNTENVACADFNPPGSTDDAEQDFPGSGPLGWDRWDTLWPIAPKPLLVSVSHKDFFGTYSPRYIENGWEEFGKLKRAYEILEKPEQIAWDGTALPHGLAYDTRMLIYRWFGKWLRGDDKPITEEPPTALERDETLWSTPKGNTVISFGGETPFTMNKARPRLRDARPLKELLGIKVSSVLPSVRSRMNWGGIDVEAIEVKSDPDVWVPAWVYRKDKPKHWLVLVQSGGRLVNWREDELFHQLALRGVGVCVPDVRGVGDLTPEFGRGAARHARNHNDEDHYAWSSLILGKPLLAQRTADIVSITRAMAAPVTLAAQGRMTVPAICAALLDSGIQGLYLSGGVVSWQSIVESELYEQPLANFLPGVLEHTDLPKTVTSLAPRKVILGGMANGQGRTMPVSEVRQLYPDTGHVEILPDARWDVERLLYCAGAT